MRYGYSLLLREFVEAEEVNYGDCEQFGITCPVCREPVFKKTRVNEIGTVTHFLSHYKAETEEEKDCELRVVSMVRGHIEPFNAESRQQSLRRFLLSFRTTIVERQQRLYPPGEFQKAFQRLLSRPVFDDFALYAREALTTLLRFDNPRQEITGMLAAFPDYQHRSPFWQRRQAAYILDVIQHLVTPQARQNMWVLAAAAFINIGLWAENYRRELRGGRLRIDVADYAPLPAVDIIEALVKGKSKTALMKLTQRLVGANRTRDHRELAAATHRIYVAMVAELTGPLIGILGDIPFTDLAKRGTAAEKEEGYDMLKSFMEDLLRKLELAMKQARAG